MHAERGCVVRKEKSNAMLVKIKRKDRKLETHLLLDRWLEFCGNFLLLSKA